ncbi:MAG: hypothetical protein ACO3NE_10680 [Alphaproteobacteria bacterium]
MRVITVLVVMVQLLDMAVHVFSNQAEPSRIASNLILAAGVLFAGRMDGGRSQLILILSILVYAVLNLVFLVQNGMVNTATGSARIPLFGFVIVSLVLSSLLVYRRPK